MTDFKILTTLPAIEAISEEWRDLHARAKERRGLFSDDDSFAIWWRTVGQTGRSPYVATARDKEDGRLVGVLPLSVARKRGLRILQAAGYKATSVCEILCETPEIADGLWNAARHGNGYDFADIRDVYAGSLCHNALARFATRRDVSKAYSLNLSAWKDGEEWFKKLPRDMRYETRRKLRNLEEKGPVVFKVYDSQPDEPFPEGILDELLRHKLNWCRTRDKEGLFSQPKACDFYRELARSAAKRGALNLGWLCCGETAVGYVLNFQRDGILSGYVTGYAPEWSSFSPGILTLTHAIRWAIDHGKKSYDLNQGDYAYKQKYSNAERECAEFTFCGTTLKGRLAEKLYFALRGSRRNFQEKRDELTKKKREGTLKK